MLSRYIDINIYIYVHIEKGGDKFVCIHTCVDIGVIPHRVHFFIDLLYFRFSIAAGLRLMYKQCVHV